MRVFKNKWFDKFCKKQRIGDKELCQLIEAIENGNIDADYGGGVIKQRLARKNQGKSGGYRCIILYRIHEKIFFVYGFAKKDRDNIEQQEEIAFKDLAQEMLGLSDAALNRLIEKNILMEVHYGKDK